MNKKTINNTEDILDDQIINEDVNLPHSLRRSIWLIEDEEDGNTYTADEILDDVSQDILFNIRTTLTAAYKSGKYKYICKECQQPLGLKIRTNEGDEFPFFSHYQNSGPCPRKSQIEIDPTYSTRDFENAFQASSLYQMMMERLQATLCMGNSFDNITISKLISSPEIKGYRKPAIYTIFQHEKEVCFDLLVSNPELGLLVGRNAFYKKHKMFYLWIFPSFTTHYQQICQKDILYMNRRNVFVFDSKDYYTHENKQFCSNNTNPGNHVYAYEESIRQNRLMLNCYWQSPKVTEIDGKKQISIRWNGPDLVAFEDLNFDFDSYEVYYHDSDVDFYNTYPTEIQRLIDEWIKIKKDRWIKIFDGIKRRKILYAQLMQRRERKERLNYYYSLLESGDVEPTPFYDEETKRYGYKIDDFDIIQPIYYEVKPFYCGYAWVRKKTKWGVIDYRNNRICNFQYPGVYELGNGISYVGKSPKYVLVNHKGELLGYTTFYKIELLQNGLFKISNNCKGYGFYAYEEKWGLINREGKLLYPCEYNDIRELFNGCLALKKKGKWIIISDRGKLISYHDHYEIGDFDNNAITVRQNGKWGTIDYDGNIMIPFEYDNIINENDLIEVQKGGKWGVVNSSNQVVIPIKYDEIGYTKNGIVSVRKGKWWKKITLLKKSNKIDLSKLKEDTIYNATTTGFVKMGVFIEIPNIGVGLIPAKEILSHNKTLKNFKRETKVKVTVLNINVEKKRATFKIVD